MSNYEILEEKQSLIDVLSRYDSDLKVEDVVQTDSIDLFESNTLLLQILLEIACRNIEPNLQRRQILFTRMWNKITEAQIIGKPVFHFDELSSVRSKAATEFEKELIKENSKIKSETMGNVLNSQIQNQKSNDESSINAEKYELEFDELSRIGKGGFGTVWKVRHKIDGLIYAVKKILFKYKKDSDYIKVIREVKNFATLKHLNVVGYNQAWFEFLLPIDSEKSAKHLSDTNFKSIYEHKEFESVSSASSEISSDGTFTEIDFGFGKSEMFLKQNQSKDCSLLKFTSNSPDSDDKKEEKSNNLFEQYNISPLHKTSVVRMILYIQMEYCDFVLRDWLDERAKGNCLPFQLSTSEIFKDILNGVSHIHSKGIIHRDLKPQNIFYSAQNNAMKIGDFGLATLNTTLSQQDGCLSDYHSSNCGTPPYAAPEQRNKHIYDSKVDMYSLGVILIELLINAQTHMEFSTMLNKITSGSIPKEFAKNWPNYISLIQDLIATDPKKRPSAEEVLSSTIINTFQSSLVPNASPKVNQESVELKILKEALAEKDKYIKELETQLREQSIKF